MKKPNGETELSSAVDNGNHTDNHNHDDNVEQEASNEFLLDVVRSRASGVFGGAAGSNGGNNESASSRREQQNRDVRDDKVKAAKVAAAKTLDGDAKICATKRTDHHQDNLLAGTDAAAQKMAAAGVGLVAPTNSADPDSVNKRVGPPTTKTTMAITDNKSSSGNLSSLPGAFHHSPSWREQGGSEVVDSHHDYELEDHDEDPQTVRETNSQANNNNNELLLQPPTPTTTTTTTTAVPTSDENEDNWKPTTNSSIETSHEESTTNLSLFTDIEGGGTTSIQAELVNEIRASILRPNVILLSLEEKERMARFKKRLLILIATLIFLVGTAATIAFTTVGITKAIQEQDSKFTISAKDTVYNIGDAFEEYVNAVALVHMRCRNRDFSRQHFRDLYEYLVEEGLQFKAVQFLPNTTHAERPAREAASRSFYSQHYPYINYTGFVGFNNLNGSGGFQPRQQEPWYFPIHYMEPIMGNEAAIDLDYHSSEVRIRAVDAVFEHAKPSLSDRLNLVKKAGQVSRCGNHNGPSYGVVLAHPGINLTRTSHPTNPLGMLDDGEEEEKPKRPPYNASHPDAGFVDDVWPRDMAAMVLCIPDLLKRSMAHDQDQNKAVYIHDMNHLSPDPVFMGGADFHAAPSSGSLSSANDDTSATTDRLGEGVRAEPTFLDEVALEELKGPSKFQQLKYQGIVKVANRNWTVTVVAIEGTYKPQYTFVILGGVIIFVGTLLLASWVYKKTMNNNSTSEEEYE